jgi:hypothetical protein
MLIALLLIPRMNFKTHLGNINVTFGEKKAITLGLLNL